MEVTKSTFNKLLPTIKESISNSTFLAIDCEFSGLGTGNEINGFDSQKLYYEKIRRGCRDFLVIQFGLCTFRYDNENKCFKQRAFNFYIFPKAIPKYVSDQRFLCQVSSIDFLVAQDFDFNKLFKHGIPYLNSVQENKYKEALHDMQKFRAQNGLGNNSDNTNKVVATRETDKTFVKNVHEQIEAFIKSDEEELVLPRCNGFLRLLIYQLVRENFDNKVNIRTRADNRDRIIVITRFKSMNERKEELGRLIEEEENEFENTIGFTKVIKFLVESGKLIVGHNMALDLLHTIDKFLTPLPEDYEDFKECAHCLFPKILDTKYLTIAEPFINLISSNVLGHLLETISKPPFVIPKIEVEGNGFGYNLNQKKEHEAGYDAYITGVCLLTMWRYLGQGELEEDNIFGNLHLLTPYMNKLYLMRLQDCPYIHLGGEDPNPSRDHVFYFTFPKEWRSSDISQLFGPFGSVHIAWINDTSAYIGLINKQQAAVALSTLSQSDTYTITTYAKRQAQLAGLPSITRSPIIRKRSSDGFTNKRRRISGKDIPFNRSIDPVLESPEVDEISDKTSPHKKNLEVVPVVKTSRKRTVSKTFEEDSSWD
ncbi:hypothetical protein Trydic_g3401 [Trypoxylus dichotomus]